MATALMLPDGLAPSNLHLRPSVKTKFVDGDVLNICERLAEISPRLFVVELSEDRKDAAWVVMEMCDDGVARRVNKYQELDQRMLVDVQRMLRIPFEHRLQAAQDDIDAANAKLDEDNLEKLYETVGLPMREMFERHGFIGHRPTSYPKLGVAAPQRGGRLLR